MMKTIAIDFDGVIHAYSKGWQGGALYDSPVKGAIDAVRKLLEDGYKVVIFTARPPSSHLGEASLTEWLEIYFPELHSWKEKGHFDITNIKPAAIAYIDDRGIRFTTWDDMLKYFI